MNLLLSDSESNSYGYSVYRSSDYQDEFDSLKFLNAAYQSEVDVVKLKLSLSNQELHNQLNRARFPFGIQTVIQRNQVAVPNQLSLPKMSGFNVEKVDKGSLQLLLELVKSVIKSPTSIKYKSAFLPSNEDEYLVATQNYLSGFLKREGYAVWLVKKASEPVAYFSGFFQDDSFEGVLYGVHPAYRKQGLSHFIYQTMLAFCSKKGVRSFKNDVEVHNLGSTIAAAGIGMSNQLYYHINFYCFLSNKFRIKEDLWESHFQSFNWQSGHRNIPTGKLLSSATTANHSLVQLTNGQTIMSKTYRRDSQLIGHELYH